MSSNSTTGEAGQNPAGGEDPLEDSEVREQLEELPPSAKLVVRVLADEGALPQSRLADETLLPTRTLRYALNRLTEADIIDSRYYLRDARKRLYFLDS